MASTPIIVEDVAQAEELNSILTISNTRGKAKSKRKMASTPIIVEDELKASEDIHDDKEQYSNSKNWSPDDFVNLACPWSQVSQNLDTINNQKAATFWFKNSSSSLDDDEDNDSEDESDVSGLRRVVEFELVYYALQAFRSLWKTTQKLENTIMRGRIRVFNILIFLFLGSVEGFSSKLQPCTFNKDKMCKSALAHAAFSTVAFVLGAITSVISGFHGMKITTYANARTTLEARKCVGKAFITAFRYGAVMGFLLSANGLLVLYITINVFKLYYGDDWEGLFKLLSVTG
ncbi:hypothetical protein GIB67_005067 [Kingdonia uniflora]|uniref:H(+)-exporting diphosphatase n=1 Tax=Kingdonia uniflora TaxID=39325 RepID=A0A7J7P813_9MAGN|nr:hypothetical protein GIB67_005067 [Kingdonia uniflora]